MRPVFTLVAIFIFVAELSSVWAEVQILPTERHESVHEKEHVKGHGKGHGRRRLQNHAREEENKVHERARNVVQDRARNVVQFPPPSMAKREKCELASLLPRKALIGMVHVHALPGTPFHSMPLSEIVRIAREEAVKLESWGVDAILIENMHDRPYMPPSKIGPEIVSAMTAVGLAIRSHTRVPLGLQILAAGNKHAIAVAQTIGASFVRVENFVFAHVADEGLMPDAEAPELLRYRRLLGAEDVCIVADIKKKHSAHAITQDVSLAITAEAAVFFGADGVLITGKTTGDPADPTDVLAVKDFFAHNTRVARPIWIGSGVTPENLHNVFPNADAFIVGSYLKVDGWWENQLDHTRAKALVAAFKKLRDAAE
eukprot:TRINITY_DN126_c0_g1_i4.p1 TRINITY_DN126_c0_g1~~TRINITY_DN126_c0_g1_i4.p1  ORF type:complete len:371 (-),score=61.34 TRINITY_DN126_c0_g1_i4:248-1360(-)